MATALVLALAPVLRSEPVTPLPNAHAHNDYLHPRPLLDALEHGFTSVEADVHLVDGDLLVAHDRDEVRPGRTLERLYLDPLLERVRENSGSVHSQLAPFTLLIDFKSSGESTYAALREKLQPYREMLTEFTPDSTTPHAVTIVISGDRPTGILAAEPRRWAAIDGRLSDLDSDPSVHLVPLVSQSWRSVFGWRGLAPFAPEERERLHGIVRRAHAQGRRVRFWATPDRPEMWAELLAAEVDLINTDDLAGLRDFLLRR